MSHTDLRKSSLEETLQIAMETRAAMQDGTPEELAELDEAIDTLAGVISGKYYIPTLTH